MEITKDEKVAVVKDYVTLSGSWNVQLFGGKLPEEICGAILSVNLLIAESGLDQYAWDLNSDGSFSI